MLSKITDKYQTTVPKEIRERLKLSKNDSLDWTLTDTGVMIRSAKTPLLSMRGLIKTGHGDIAADIRKAQSLRAKRYK